MHRPDAECTLTRRQHFLAWNDVMAAILEVWHQIKNPIQSIEHLWTYELMTLYKSIIFNIIIIIICIDMKNIPAKFHPDPTWKDGALGFFWRPSRQQEQLQDE